MLLIISANLDSGYFIFFIFMPIKPSMSVSGDFKEG